MTAGYLQSDFQKYALAVIDQADQSSPDFFVVAPFVIDCSSDRAGFDAVVTARQRDLLIEHHELGTAPSGKWPRQPVADYVREHVFAKARLLDPVALEQAQRFLMDWISERAKAPGQASKAAIPNPPTGVDVILPLCGIRLSAPLFGLPGTTGPSPRSR